MSINFAGGTTAYELMIDNFAKTISRTPVTKTTDNITGDETLTEGASANITGAFFRSEDAWSQNKEALFDGADAVLLVKDGVTLNKDDKLTYDSEDYRVVSITDRRLGTTVFYQVARCFKT